MDGILFTPEQFKEMQGNWAQLKDKLAEADVEMKKHGEMTAETKATIDALNGRIDEMEVAAKRRIAVTGDDAGSKGLSEAEIAHKAAFTGFLRKGADISAEHVKTLQANTDSDGGYLIPNQQANQIIQKLIELSPVRELATVGTLSTGSTMDFPAEGSQEFEVVWEGETQNGGETDAASLAMISITARNMAARPRATRNMLDDSAFNIEAWLTARVSTMLAKGEGTAFLTGNGTTRPQGILVAPGVASVASGATNVITADSIKALFYALPAFYARNATWLMHRGTVLAIRLLKDGDGRYIWQPGTTMGEPPSIEGQPYREAVDMPTVATGAYPIVIGDFRAGYQILDRQGIRVERDTLTVKPLVEFYTTKRVGGAVVLAEAFRKMLVS